MAQCIPRAWCVCFLHVVALPVCIGAGLFPNDQNGDAWASTSTVKSEPVAPFRDRIELGKTFGPLGLRVGAELGVRHGRFASQLLAVWQPTRYVLVDAWTEIIGYTHDEFDANLRTTMRQMIQRPGCSEPFENAVKSARCGTEIRVCRNWTHVCAEQFAPAEFDFVYVDALHDYKGTLRDLSMWWPKLRRGGIIAGHDYLDMNSTVLGSSDRIKVRDWRRNYDGTWEPTGKLVKGAVHDFFECQAMVAEEQIVAPRNAPACSHRRHVTVAFNPHPNRLLQNEYPPTWAVRK